MKQSLNYLISHMLTMYQLIATLTIILRWLTPLFGSALPLATV